MSQNVIHSDADTAIIFIRNVTPSNLFCLSLKRKKHQNFTFFPRLLNGGVMLTVSFGVLLRQEMKPDEKSGSRAYYISTVY